MNGEKQRGNKNEGLREEQNEMKSENFMVKWTIHTSRNFKFSE